MRRLTRAARERVEMDRARDRRWAERINRASSEMLRNEDSACEEYARYGR